MRFVVTGATSFIGAELVKYLAQHNHSVVAVCRQASSAEGLFPNGTEVVLSEMADYGNLHALIGHADVFVNLAWAGTGHDGRNVSDVQKDNIEFTKRAFLSAKQMGCQLFVQAGSQAEYGSTSEPQSEDSRCQPFSEYGKAKLQVKEELFSLAEQAGMKYVHLRIFSIFGENDHPWTLVMSALQKMCADDAVDLSPCTQNWNFVYVKDAVRQVVVICENAVMQDDFIHEVYNVASDDTRPLKDFVMKMKALSESNSILNFGAVQPANFVSLQPDMSKTSKVVGALSNYAFEDVVGYIINKFRQQ